MNSNHDYVLFHKFIETYSQNGFKELDSSDSLMQELELSMKKNNQFFFVGDIIQIKILFTSQRSSQIMGVDPEYITPYIFFEATHPDDLQQHSLARTHLFKLAQELYLAKKGSAILSTNLKIKDTNDKYNNLLFQCFLFYSENPIKTVYILQVHTVLDWRKYGKQLHHYYSGNDLSLFKYPDEELMHIGSVFTKREFEIIKLIELGLNSEQIAEKLFLSHFTVNAHRANILKKTQYASMSEVIHHLNLKGML